MAISDETLTRRRKPPSFGGGFFVPAQKRKGSEEPLNIWIIIYFNDSKKYELHHKQFQLYKPRRLIPYHAPFFHNQYNMLSFQEFA